MKLIFQKLRLLSLLLTLGLCLTYCHRQAPDDDAKAKAQTNILVSGTIEISKNAEQASDPLSVLFIMLRNPEGGMVAVKKMLPPFRFPLEFKIEEQDVMISGADTGKSFRITARLDQDGNANPAQKGDILGKSEEDLVKLGTSKVKVILDQVVE